MSSRSTSIWKRLLHDGQERRTRFAKLTLWAEIDEVAWSYLYRTVSRAFPGPESGKIAVKVINHCGDEVLRVFDV